MIIVAIVLIYALRAGVALAVAAINYNKWTAQGITSYSVTVKYGTGWGTYNSGRETVKNGTLVRSNAGFTEPAIDRLFNEARSCAVNPIIIFPCWVDFDPQYGYPSRYLEADLDLGNIIEITDLTPEPK